MMTGGAHSAERIAAIVQFVENASEPERQRIIQLADGSGLRVFRSEASAIEDGGNGRWQTDLLRRGVSSHLARAGGQPFRLHLADDAPADEAPADEALPEAWKPRHHQDHMSGEPDEVLLVSVRLEDGSWLNFAAPIDVSEPFWSLRTVLSMAVMLLAVVILAAIIVRRMTEPLATFVRAAERLGSNVNAPPIPERGPAEVRQAVRAFNDMQARIRRFVEDRTRMLAAIAHDLGTPITRLRLRAEFVEDDEQRRKMLADLEAMEKMVASALAFARDDTAREPHVMVDLRSLLQRVCDDISDAGHEVRLETGEHAVRYGCRPAAMRRALTNLVDNAVKYGHRARVSLREDDEAFLITVDDDGPGIPEMLHDEAFKPFRRLEVSRGAETGGTGLGLTVARTIIRAHGGDIALDNREGGGLRVQVHLPR
jgi:signal transduction histidine kinase